jgi:D-serine deaminase-like pyridoxal phosphate-dependent protein
MEQERPMTEPDSQPPMTQPDSQPPMTQPDSQPPLTQPDSQPPLRPKCLADIQRPSFVVDMAKVRRNIARMAARAVRNNTMLRPHFKTHQSVQVSALFMEMGIKAATVSSAGMASFFADHGWKDLTIAFPVNIRELATLDNLAGRMHLGLLVDQPAAVAALATGLSHPVDIWIKIDTGLRRCGLQPDDVSAVASLADLVKRLARPVDGGPNLRLAGLLTHDSRTYLDRGKDAITAIYRQGAHAMFALRDRLAGLGHHDLLVSVGDTPSASLVEDWLGVDEARPGNFAYYDLQQVGTGACAPQDVAVAVACPVVGIYPQRSEAVVYGGAVHLSKQLQPPMAAFLPGGPPELSLGTVWRTDPENGGGTAAGAVSSGTGSPAGACSSGLWSDFMANTWVSAVHQEHGIIRMPRAELDRLKIGDLLLICPVHSCLAAHALRADTLYL